jgi:hypothetical protein
MTRTSRVAGIRANDAKYEREINTADGASHSNNSNRATVNGTRNQIPRLPCTAAEIHACASIQADANDASLASGFGI